MKFSITINGQDHTLEIARDGGVSCRLDGVPFDADVVEVEPGVYSLLLGGKSFRVRVARQIDTDSRGGGGNTGEYKVEVGGAEYDIAIRDPRKLPRRRAKPVLEGAQNVAARMPGKVVKLLVTEGQSVESGQGLIVVEAMKMQNEIKCPASGRIQKILVREGQAVNAGEVLLTVE